MTLGVGGFGAALLLCETDEDAISPLSHPLVSLCYTERYGRLARPFCLPSEHFPLARLTSVPSGFGNHLYEHCIGGAVVFGIRIPVLRPMWSLHRYSFAGRATLAPLGLVCLLLAICTLVTPSQAIYVALERPQFYFEIRGA